MAGAGAPVPDVRRFAGVAVIVLRIGIVGARFAADLQAANYRQLRGSRVELAAVCARTRAQAETLEPARS